VHLFATAAGLGKAAAARPIIARLNTRLTQDFSERDIATVARFLNTILERFPDREAPRPGRNFAAARRQNPGPDR
jgi:hypothetical protein